MWSCSFHGHKFHYWNTCGSPVIKRLCFFVVFFLSFATKWKNCAIVPSGHWALNTMTTNCDPMKLKVFTCWSRVLSWWWLTLSCTDRKAIAWRSVSCKMTYYYIPDVKTLQILSLHFVPTLQSEVYILYPFFSLLSAFCTNRYPWHQYGFFLVYHKIPVCGLIRHFRSFPR